MSMRSTWLYSRQLRFEPDRDRWYVLAVMTVVYALNIADRFSISTLIEPIRLELQLTDSGVAFLTGVALALFYVTIGIPIALLADKANRRNILVNRSGTVVRHDRRMRAGTKLLAVAAGAIRCGYR